MIDRPEGERPPLAEVATGSYFAVMKVVGVKELKNKLSEYLRLVKSGEVVLVTDRGDVVAELRAPARPRDPLMEDPWFAEQVRLGRITPAAAPGTPIPPMDGPVLPMADVLRDLEANRDDR